MRGAKTVVITGASAGIGAATARAFARQGCSLVLGARRAAELMRLRDEIALRQHVDVEALPCDVRRDEDVCRLVETAVQRHGRLDVMVNNAGAGLYGRVEDTPVEEFRDLIEVNLLGVQRGLRAAVPVMRRQGRGHIVVVGSVAGKQSWPWHGAYAATKYALTGLMRALRAELAGSGVTASLILPVSTRTEFFRAARVLTPGYRPRPLGWIQTPETVAERIVRSVDHPRGEIDTFPPMRLAYVLAEAFPSLADFVAARYYEWMASRLPAEASRSTTEAAAEPTSSAD